MEQSTETPTHVKQAERLVREYIQKLYNMADSDMWLVELEVVWEAKMLSDYRVFFTTNMLDNRRYMIEHDGDADVSNIDLYEMVNGVPALAKEK